MTGSEFSLLAVTLGFVALVIWVYSPRRRNRLESYGSMPLEEEDHSAAHRRVADEGDRS